MAKQQFGQHKRMKAVETGGKFKIDDLFSGMKNTSPKGDGDVHGVSGSTAKKTVNDEDRSATTARTPRTLK